MPDEFQDLINKLTSLGGDVLQQAERTALTEVGKLVQEALVTLTPVQSGVPEGLLKPGQLAESMKARVHIATDTSTVDKADVSRVTIGPTTQVCKDVANWIENGHINTRANKGEKRTDPNPFIRTAQDETEEAAVETYQSIMTAAVTAAMGK